MAIGGRATYILSVPAFVRPCIPIARKSVPTGEAWLHELKIDSYRFQIAKEGRQVRLYSWSGTEWTGRLPGFAASFLALPCLSALLDGELVLPDGGPEVEGEVEEHELLFFAFDLLHRDGKDLRHLPLVERRRRLVRLVGRADIPSLHLVEAFADGAKLLTEAERHEFEGVISKRRDARYRSGECSDWVKVKTAAWRAANRAGVRLSKGGSGCAAFIRIAQPPKVTFVTRLQLSQLPQPNRSSASGPIDIYPGENLPH